MRKKLSKLLSFSLVAYALSFFGNIILAKFYDPTSFGLYATFIVSIAMVQPLLCLGYEGAILVAKKKEISFVLVNFCIYFIILMSMGGLIILIAYSVILKNYEVALFTIAIFATMFFSCNQVLQNLANRLGYFSILGFCRIQEQVGVIIFAIGLSFYNIDLLALPLAYLMNLSLIFILLFYFNKFEFMNLNKQTLYPVLTRYKNFFKFSMLSNVVLAVSSNFHIVLLGIIYSSEIAGLVSFSQKFAFLPYYLIGIPVSQILNEKILTLIENPKKLLNMYYKVLVLLILLSAFILIVTYVFPEELFLLILNPQWESSFGIIKILMFWGVSQLIGSTLSVMYMHLERLKELLFLNLTNIILTLLLFFIIFKIGISEVDSLKFLVTLKVLFYSTMIILPIKFIKRLDV